MIHKYYTKDMTEEDLIILMLELSSFHQEKPIENIEVFIDDKLIYSQKIHSKKLIKFAHNTKESQEVIMPNQYTIKKIKIIDSHYKWGSDGNILFYSFYQKGRRFYGVGWEHPSLGYSHMFYVKKKYAEEKFKRDVEEDLRHRPT